MLSLSILPEGRPIHVRPDVLAIVGYAGRNREAVMRHVEELAVQGIPPPPRIPMVYPVTADRLVQDDYVEVTTPETSGEAEVVLILTGGTTLVALGSDHTDRDLERYDVQASKQICSKVVSTTCWRLQDVVGHWDRIELQSWVGTQHDLVRYQEGSVDELLAPKEILEFVVGMCNQPLVSAVIFSGTLPLLGSKFISAPTFRAVLHDPIADRSLELMYAVRRVDWIKAPQPSSSPEASPKP
jgi:Protein of unknown function (DUF2848)